MGVFGKARAWIHAAAMAELFHDEIAPVKILAMTSELRFMVVIC